MIGKNSKQIIFVLLVGTIIFQNCTLNNNAEKPVTIKGNHTFNIKIKGAPNKTFLLSRYYGDKTIAVDTIRTDRTGRLKTSFDSSYLPGMYKVSLSKNSFFNFIINNEDIELQTFIVNAQDSMRVIQSKENKLLYQYLRNQNSFNKKINVLGSVIQNYPKSENYYTNSIDEFFKVQDKFQQTIKDITEENPELFVTKYIQFIGFNRIDPKLSEQEQK